MAQNITLLGANYSAVPAVQLPKTGGGTATFTDVTDTTAAASDVATGKYFYTANGTRTAGTNSGGGGGASNFVTGTFTTPNSTSTNATVTVPYSGTGYPIVLVVYVEGGMYNSDISGWYNSLVRYAVGQFCITKAKATVAPTYTGSDTANGGSVQVLYKNSTSTATSYTGTRSANTSNAYYDHKASGGATACVCWRNNKTISYRTAGGTSSTYGLLADTTYRYIAMYSE